MPQVLCWLADIPFDMLVRHWQVYAKVWSCRFNSAFWDSPIGFTIRQSHGVPDSELVGTCIKERWKWLFLQWVSAVGWMLRAS